MNIMTSKSLLLIFIHIGYDHCLKNFNRYLIIFQFKNLYTLFHTIYDYKAGGSFKLKDFFQFLLGRFTGFSYISSYVYFQIARAE